MLSVQPCCTNKLKKIRSQHIQARSVKEYVLGAVAFCVTGWGISYYGLGGGFQRGTRIESGHEGGQAEGGSGISSSSFLQYVDSLSSLTARSLCAGTESKKRPCKEDCANFEKKRGKLDRLGSERTKIHKNVITQKGFIGYTEKDTARLVVLNTEIRKSEQEIISAANAVNSSCQQSR